MLLSACLLAVTSLCFAGEISHEDIPVIDFGRWFHGEEGKARVAADIFDAVKDVGLFYVINHKVPEEVTQNAVNAMKQFFDLDQDEKDALAAYTEAYYTQPKAQRAHKLRSGYGSIGDERSAEYGAPDYKEVFDIGMPSDDPIVMKYLGENRFPDDDVVQGFEDASMEFIAESYTLVNELLHAVAMSLNLEEDIFDELFKDPMVILRYLKYDVFNGEEEFLEPNLEEMRLTEENSEADDGRDEIQTEDVADAMDRIDYDPSFPKNKPVGCGQHSDFGAFSMVWQETPGLQALTRSNDKADICVKGTFFEDMETCYAEWVDVPPIQKTFVVNIGETIQRLTNDEYYATPHRVSLPESDARYSMVLFFEPNPESTIKPIMPLEDGSGKYKYGASIAGHKGLLLSALQLLR